MGFIGLWLIDINYRTTISFSNDIHSLQTVRSSTEKHFITYCMTSYDQSPLAQHMKE